MQFMRTSPKRKCIFQMNEIAFSFEENSTKWKNLIRFSTKISSLDDKKPKMVFLFHLVVFLKTKKKQNKIDLKKKCKWIRWNAFMNNNFRLVDKFLLSISRVCCLIWKNWVCVFNWWAFSVRLHLSHAKVEWMKHFVSVEWRRFVEKWNPLAKKKEIQIKTFPSMQPSRNASANQE